MNYEPEVIRARFVEAAYTERFLSSAVAPTCKGYWPEFIHDTADKEGWDDAAHLDNAAKRMGRASTGAISRHQECLDWTRTIITDEMRRHVLWSWAFCKANGWDFGARCNRKGWARPTAYRRLNASIEAISYKLRMESLFVRLPDDKWLRHETPDMAPISSTLGNSDNAVPAIPNKPYRTEPSLDLIQTQEDADLFAAWLKKRNEREARRRAKLGMDEA
jgi:hypothetical protein